MLWKLKSIHIRELAEGQSDRNFVENRSFRILGLLESERVMNVGSVVSLIMGAHPLCWPQTHGHVCSKGPVLMAEGESPEIEYSCIGIDWLQSVSEENRKSFLPRFKCKKKALRTTTLWKNFRDGDSLNFTVLTSSRVSHYLSSQA